MNFQDMIIRFDLGENTSLESVLKNIIEDGYSENPHQTQKNGFLDPPKRVLAV